MKITVVGLGYVGLSMGILLSQRHEVVALDIMAEKVDQVNRRVSPLADELMQEYLSTKELDLKATIHPEEAYRDSQIVIISTPTNYNEENNSFDTRSIESALDDILRYHPDVPVVIKSTIPIGYTHRVREAYKKENIVFSPEFLREGRALYDNLYPSRIIVGDKGEVGQLMLRLLQEGALIPNVPSLLVKSKEAESIKLFANTYLAMRVAFFNELDSYAEANGLSTEEIIRGISFDSRVGDYYNNPSFGYGGYCLPKDTKQLLFNYQDTPNELIEAIVRSNDTRKQFMIDQILSKNPKVVGVYRLVMKTGSDNFRSSAIWDIMKGLKDKVKILVFEPTLKTSNFEGYPLEKDFYKFTNSCDIIIANRLEDQLKEVEEKVYTRDIFTRD